MFGVRIIHRAIKTLRSEQKCNTFTRSVPLQWENNDNSNNSRNERAAVSLSSPHMSKYEHLNVNRSKINSRFVLFYC